MSHSTAHNVCYYVNQGASSKERDLVIALGMQQTFMF